MDGSINPYDCKYEFPNSVFDFLVQIDPHLGAVELKVTHNTEFLQWGKTIDKPIVQRSSDGFNMSLTPTKIFNIFKGFVKGKLGPQFELHLPDGYKTADTPLPIEIVIIVDCGDDKPEKDTKLITLDPIPIDNERRIDLKLIRRDERINSFVENSYSKNEVDALFAKLRSDASESGLKLQLKDETYTKQEVDDRINLLMTGLNGKVQSGTSYTKQEFDQRFANFEKIKQELDRGTLYTKQELDQRFADFGKQNADFGKQIAILETAIAELRGLMSMKAQSVAVYTKAETDAIMTQKVQNGTVYTKAEIDAAVTQKVQNGTVYTKAETDNLVNSRVQNGTVYTKPEADGLLNQRMPLANTYTKAEADGKFAAKA
jgi:hypothetical protein